MDCLPASAPAAAQMLAQRDRRAVSTEAFDEIARVEDPLMLAAAADGHEGHLGI
jgi:hypothetical protein